MPGLAAGSTRSRMAFTLPPIAMAGVTNAVAAGHTTPGEATEIAKVIDAYVRVYQTAELNGRGRAWSS
jgi:hypothetical protein